MRSQFFSVLLLVAALPCLGEEADVPTLSGYVTRAASPVDFDVNGQHILLGQKTKFQHTEKVKSQTLYLTAAANDLNPYLGEPMDIYGEVNRKTHTIAATRVVSYPRRDRPVAGFAIIDALLPLPAGASPSDHLLRADGYSILVNVKTQTTWNQPLTASSDITVNLWISYQGKQLTDGTVVAEKVSFTKNTISRGEDHLREKMEYDPAAVDPDAKQSLLSKEIIGIDPKQIPPYDDDEMQARVSAIGAKLVPKYQFDFPYTEETRIDFRFQVIDGPKWHEAATLPNGIILVPHQVVERMQNDSQLAAVLAESIARALEKQPLNGYNEYIDLTVANVAGTAAGFVVPGLGMVTQIATGTTAVKLERLREEQSGRVSLTLLHDAGYDIEQAPMAWWLLAPKKPQAIAETPLPHRAAYLYEVLGETWPPKQIPGA